MDKISLFRLYTEIAGRGSLIAASRALAIAPSVATQGLQQLEEMVGVELITRTTRRLALTPEGERFLADCQRILADIQESVDSLSDTGPLHGNIRLTAPIDFGRHFLPPLIDIFIQQNPGIRIELLLSDSIIDITEGRLDISLRMGPLGESRPNKRLLIHGTREVCASPDYWKEKGIPEHPRDLENHNCLVLARPDAPVSIWYFQDKNKEFGIRVSGDRTANEGATLRSWALSGAGVILNSSIDIAADVVEGRLVPVLKKYEWTENNLYNLYAVTPQGRRQSKRVMAFIDFLEERFNRPSTEWETSD